MPVEQKIPPIENMGRNFLNYHPPPSLAGELSARAGSLEYDSSVRSYVADAHTHEAAFGRPHRLMRLQTFSLSDLTRSASTEMPLYSLGRPFPDPHTLRRRSHGRIIGNIAAQMNVQAASSQNHPLPPNHPVESRTDLTGVQVGPTGIHLLALENLPEGQCIIATPALLRSFVEETRNHEYGIRYHSVNGTDPRHSNCSSEHRNTINQHQVIQKASLGKPELSSSTALEQPEKYPHRASRNSYYECTNEAYDQGHGVLPTPVTLDGTKKPTYLMRYLRFKSIMREPAAEALAAFLLSVFSGGASAQYYLTANRSVSASPKGNYATQCIGSGIGTMTGVYVAGGISGGHINPTVTLAFAIFRKFPWRKVIPYWCAQIIGASAGSATIHMIYASGLDIYEGGIGIRTFTGPSSTAGFFLAFPAEYMTNIGSFFQAFLDSAIILLFIMAIGDRKNSPPPDGISPIILMLVTIGVAFALGSQTSYAMNPATDIASRIVASLMGYGSAHWAYRDQYWLWNNWVSNIAGALFGCSLYDFLIYEGDDSPLNRPWSWDLQTWLASIIRRGKPPDQGATTGNGDHFV